jgi:runt-related transcription factor 1
MLFFSFVSINEIFIQTNLPLLQRELLHCARLAKQSPQQYLAHNERILFDPSHSPLESHDLINTEFNENGKRPTPDRFETLAQLLSYSMAFVYRTKENGLDLHIDPPPAKRPMTVSPVGSSSSRVSPGTPSYGSSGSGNFSQMRLEDIREMRERERHERERMERQERERRFSFGSETPPPIVLSFIVLYQCLSLRL